MSLYRASDVLVKHREAIEAHLFGRICDLFSLEQTVTLYDLTNTYFEGRCAGNSKAALGHSKEKRTDAPWSPWRSYSMPAALSTVHAFSKAISVSRKRWKKCCFHSRRPRTRWW